MSHLIPFLGGGLVFLSFELFLFRPELWLWAAASATLFIILGMLVPKQRFLSGREFWNYIFDPLILIWSAGLLILFFENRYFRHIYSFAIGIYIFLYFENLFYYLISDKEDGKENFLRMTNLINVVSVFLLSAGLYAIRIFMQFPIWALILTFFFFCGGMFYGTMWTLRQSWRDNLPYIAALAIVAVEVFTAVAFLPIGFYVGGAILSIVYYMTSGILINSAMGKESPRIYKRYLFVGFALLALALITARWV